MAWTPHSRPAVWVAIIDDIHNTMVEGLTEHRLGSSESGGKLLYQRLDFPWPLNDRQWVIEIANDPPLAKATDGQVWSRHWALAPSTPRWPTRRRSGRRRWTVAGWPSMASRPSLSAKARTTVGGVVPDGLVTSWAMSTLDEMLADVVRAHPAEIAHYTAEHDVGSDGTIIFIL